MKRWWFCVKKHQVNMYYQRMWAEHSWEQISEGDFTSVVQNSCTTACDSTAALLQTGTSILMLHRHFLAVRYLSRLLFRWAWAVTEQNDRVERHTAQWWRLRERGNLNTAGWCGAAHIFGCRKFSASLVNGQNDSVPRFFCIRVFVLE